MIKLFRYFISGHFGTDLYHSISFSRHLQSVIFRLSKRKYLTKKMPSNDASDLPPLITAIMNGEIDSVKLLLGNGVKVNEHYGHKSPLQTAIKNQDLEMVKVLLAHGAKPTCYFKDDSNNICFPAYEQALETGNLDIIKWLMKYGANERRFLRSAFESIDCVDKVRMLLNFGVIKPNQYCKNRNKMTPVHEAMIFCGNEEIVSILIQFGVDVNAKDEFMQTALHIAFRCRFGELELLKVLMENGANPNLKDGVGESTIEKALWKDKSTFKVILYNQCRL